MKLLTHLLALATATSAALTYKGVDWSSLLIEEAAGHSYTGLNGQKAPLETILAANGVNTVRQRLWVNPSDKNYNLDYNLRLARRAKAANLKLYLDLHFSDTWADPSHQKVPAGWPSTSDIDDLTWKLYNHTLETSNAFAAAGVPIALLSLGNEITAGALFPAGQVSTSSGWYNLARLLHSASAGVKDSKLSPKPKLMLHLDNGWNYETQQWWYDTLLKQGPFTSADFDVQGVSYYPFYNEQATLAKLKTSLTSMKQKYGKEVMVVGKSPFLHFPFAECCACELAHEQAR
jgi:arabinogalactan endo-1,4-beta-galactosidase